MTDMGNSEKEMGWKIVNGPEKHLCGKQSDENDHRKLQHCRATGKSEKRL